MSDSECIRISVLSLSATGNRNLLSETQKLTNLTLDGFNNTIIDKYFINWLSQYKTAPQLLVLLILLELEI